MENRGIRENKKRKKTGKHWIEKKEDFQELKEQPKTNRLDLLKGLQTFFPSKYKLEKRKRENSDTQVWQKCRCYRHFEQKYRQTDKKTVGKTNRQTQVEGRKQINTNGIKIKRYGRFFFFFWVPWLSKEWKNERKGEITKKKARKKER